MLYRTVLPICGNTHISLYGETLGLGGGGLAPPFLQLRSRQHVVLQHVLQSVEEQQGPKDADRGVEPGPNGHEFGEESELVLHQLLNQFCMS